MKPRGSIDFLDQLRQETQLMAGTAVNGLTPRIVELASESDDPEFVLKVYNSLKTLAGFDAVRPKEQADARPPTRINIYLHAGDGDVLASLSGPFVPETNVIDINADVIGNDDAD